MKDVLGGLWGDGGKGHFSRQEKLYFEELRKVETNFTSVLEVGPGDGAFARQLIKQRGITSYTFLDIPKGLDLLKKSFKDTVSYVSCFDYEDLFGVEFDLFVSNICIPETPKKYRESLISNVLPNCKSAMILGQLEGTWDVGKDYKKFIMSKFNENFKNVLVSPMNYCNCYSVIGF